jgi:hypothetical protein
MLDTDNYDLTAEDYDIDEEILDEVPAKQSTVANKKRSPSYDTNDYEADYHDDEFESSLGETSPLKKNSSGIQSSK